jgi:LmbE family N-acetylglucosaminyl deacetylase
LDKQDGTLPDLNSSERQQTIEQISNLLKHYQPGEVYVPHRKDCHKDHEATYYLVKEAIAHSKIKVELLQYPIWVFWRAPLFILLKLKDITAAYRLSITSVQQQKKTAIAAYPSQIKNLPRGFIKRFLHSEEIFFKAES